MKKFTNITEKRILELAWLRLLDIQEREYDLLRVLGEVGAEGELTRARIDKLRLQIEEVHDALLEVEKED